MSWWRRAGAGPGRDGAGGAAADHVVAAFVAVPRDRFLPEGARARAGFDGPLEIGHGQTSSQPRTVQDMLRLLDVRAGDRVLDVGAGSGWTTGLLAVLAGPHGSVLGLERVPELAGWGAGNLAGFLDRLAPEARSAMAPARVEAAAPHTLGRPEDAPFDRILVSAMARRLPEALVAQLADDGRMVCPVDGQMLLVQRRGDDRTVSAHGPYRFVPLIET